MRFEVIETNCFCMYIPHNNFLETKIHADLKKYEIKLFASLNVTRMHSSGMRTARLLTVSPSVHCTVGCVSAQWCVSSQGGLPGGVCPGGCVCPGLVSAQGGVWPGGCVCKGGVSAQGGIPACNGADTPMDRQTLVKT